MAEPAPGPAISLSEARLVQRLRSGEPAALRELWTRWQGPVWAVCRAMADDRAAGVQLLARLDAELGAQSRSWQEDRPLCCAVAAWLLTSLKRELQLPDPAGIHSPLPGAVQRVDQQSAQQRLSALPPETRLVYLVDLMFRCPASLTAELTGWSEDQIRAARANAAWALVAAEGA